MIFSLMTCEPLFGEGLRLCPLNHSSLLSCRLIIPNSSGCLQRSNRFRNSSIHTGNYVLLMMLQLIRMCVQCSSVMQTEILVSSSSFEMSEATSQLHQTVPWNSLPEIISLY